MSDWQVGDLALCVNDTPNSCYGSCSVRKGVIYSVAGIDQETGPNPVFGPDDSYGLYLAGVTPRSGNITGRPVGVDCRRFVKVTPPAADEFDRETIALMDRVGEPA